MKNVEDFDWSKYLNYKNNFDFKLYFIDESMRFIKEIIVIVTNFAISLIVINYPKFRKNSKI